MRMKWVSIAVAMAALAATEAHAQALDCAGRFQIVRSSRIKPGQMDTFLKAVRDQQAWYAAHALSDRMFVGRVLQPTGGGYDPDMMMTVHDAAAMKTPEGANDAAWDAFVSEFRQSSTIMDERRVCMTPAG